MRVSILRNELNLTISISIEMFIFGYFVSIVLTLFVLSVYVLLQFIANTG